ncbi:MAG TPA: hypothetical protein VF781_10405 [Solirubrobacteraceae bacterium]
MNGEGSQRDRSGAVEIDDNVIRLTDWLGPREELVPFGPATDAQEARSPSPGAGAPVPTAEDFWSESSAALQDALTAPHPKPREHQPGLPSVRRGRASAAAIWWRRRASLRPPGPAAANRMLPRPSRRAGALVMTAAALLLGVVAVLSAAGSRTATSRGRMTAAAIGRSAASATGRRSAAQASLIRVRPLRAHGSADPRPSHSGNRRTHPDLGPHHRAPAVVPAAQPVGYTTPAASSSPYSGTAGSAATSSPTTTTTSSPSPATSAGAGSSSAPQPALGASGSLAPGSSPDG